MKSRYLPERTVTTGRGGSFEIEPSSIADDDKIIAFEPAGIENPIVRYADDWIELQPGRYLFRALDAEVAFVSSSLGRSIPLDTSSRWIDCVILSPYTDLPVAVTVKTTFRFELEVDAILNIIRTADVP